VKPSLIFDLDGTLVDSLPGIAGSLNRSLTAHGLPEHPDAVVRSFVGDGLRTLVQRAAGRDTGPETLESIVALFKQDYELSWQQGTTVYPGIHNLLDELQRDGFPLAVLSNKTHDFTVAMVAAMFPRIRFTKVLGQREGTRHKPHPAGAFLIADALGVSPENCIMIGDSSIDIETARNAGMRAIAVAWGYHNRSRLMEAGATRIIETPSELPALLADPD
jgi:phosphoglycolate phosphatase